MMRTFLRSVVGAALLLAACFVAEASYGQSSWNHGFGPRNYGYSGVPYGQSYSRYTGFGYTAPYVTGVSPYYGYYYPYGGYYPYYAYDGVWLGGFSSGVYTYYPAPGYYYNYRPYPRRPHRGGRFSPNAPANARAW